jgi:hypothetical protein
MIYIQNKKAWKAIVRTHPDHDIFPPEEYPCFGQWCVLDPILGGKSDFLYLYLKDCQYMTDQIEKGREF